MRLFFLENSMSHPTCQIGLIGLAVMGENLALNIESRGFSIAVYNRTTATTEEFAANRAAGRRVLACRSLTEFVAALERPRRIIVMVKAGSAVDAVINQLQPLLEAGDIIIDCGNSLYSDTRRRESELTSRGIQFLGVGVSGGEEGALKGPAIMAGGSSQAWDQVASVFEAISAKARDGEPCCAWLGPDGAGHFVKMVHNGIEYGDMQLITECAWLLRHAVGLSGDALSAVFAEWNRGPLDSYLIEITAAVLKARDERTGLHLVDVIADRAEQKGTGKWTLLAAVELGVPVPTIAAAVDARIISSAATLRQKLASTFPVSATSPAPALQAADIHDALFAAKISSYAQGFDLLRVASAAFAWSLDLSRIAAIWRGGCIIRAAFLDHIRTALAPDAGLPHLLMAPFFAAAVAEAEGSWRKALAAATLRALPVPALAASLEYFDAMRSARLPANLLQAQRDFFGAHTFERTDGAGRFHAEWMANPSCPPLVSKS